MEHDAGRRSSHHHAVRFYEDDTSLCRIVAGFLGDGLAAGQPGVVIAVPSHCEGISQGLRALSFDVDRLRHSGDLMLLDAEETLSTFMKDGRPDSAAFRESVGGLLDNVTGGRRSVTVRAFGEMVDCLWRNDAADWPTWRFGLKCSGTSSRIRAPFHYCARIPWAISTNTAHTRTSAVSTRTWYREPGNRHPLASRDRRRMRYVPNRSAARARAQAASSSRFFGVA